MVRRMCLAIACILAFIFASGCGESGPAPQATKAAVSPATGSTSSATASSASSNAASLPSDAADSESMDVSALELWSFEDGARPQVSEADGNFVFVTSVKGFAALDGQNGKAIWRQDEIVEDVKTTVHDDKLLLTNGGKDMIVLRKEDGHELWRLGAFKEIETKPVIIEDTAYITSKDGLLYAVDMQSGEQLWQFRPEDDSFPISDLSQLIADENTSTLYYASSYMEALFAVDAHAGEEVWRVAAPGIQYAAGNQLTLLCEDDVLVLLTHEGVVHAIDKQQRKLIWSKQLGAALNEVDAFVRNGQLFVQTDEAQIQSFRLRDGHRETVLTTQERIYGMTLFDDTHMLIRFKDDVSIADLSSGRTQSLRLSAGPLESFFASDHDLYVTTSEGRLIKYRIEM